MQLLTLARDLKRRKARERRALFVAEGVRTVEELLRSGVAVRGALSTSTLRETPRGEALLASLASRGIQTEDVSAQEFLSAADTEHPQGVLAIAEVPAHTFRSLAPRLSTSERLLVLDAIQDPGNAGTLVRTGAALGAAAVVALPGTADLWNAKAIRAAAGAHFHIPTLHGTAEELLAFLGDERFVLWGAAADGETLGGAPPPPRLALAVGNEGAGLSAAVRAAAARLTGDLQQLPPMVSALKHQGRRLHALARLGETVERATRPVHVAAWTWLAFEPGFATFTVRCSGGTYVRTLVHDLGAALGCGAALGSLRRLASLPFTIEQACPWALLDGGPADEVLAAHGVPLARALDVLPSVRLDAPGAEAAGHGRRVPVRREGAPLAAGERSVVLRDPDGLPIGLGELEPGDGGELALACPHVVFPWAVREGSGA
ncbi:MAG: TrmH family RNA methyltransferase [Gemmatimonadales bacterium]